MGVMWSRSGSYEFDNSGVRAPGALAYFFVGTTSTPKTVYQNAAESTAYEETVEADGNGRWPAVFIPFGTYSITIKTAGGTTLFQVSGVPNPEPTDPGEGVDANSIFQTGDFLIVGKNGTRAGFVRCNGRTIGNAASGGTERANADTVALFTYIYDNYANGQAAVSSGRGASAAADYAANKTITLPNYQGAALVGFDDMGASAGSFFGSAPVVTGSGILAGSVLGASTHTILEGQLPTHAHSVSITSGGGSAHTHGTGTFATAGNGAHTHTATTGTENTGTTHLYDRTTGNTFSAAGGGTSVIATLNQTATATGNPDVGHTHDILTTSDPGNHTHTFTGSLATESAHTHSVSGNTGNIGSDTAHNIMARSAPVTILMKL
jgi:hypothetical protein